jgi:hypothetical protein
MLGKHTLGPKEKTSLRITFDTTGRPGPFRKIVTLTADSPGEEELEVTVEGTVLEAPCAKIQVAPRQSDLGTITSGPLKMKPFTVTNPGSIPLVITKIYVQGTGSILYQEGKEGPLVILPAGKKFLDFAISPETGEGKHEVVIVIESNAKNASKGAYMIIVSYTIS